MSLRGDEIIADLFAGGGGASCGIRDALGRDVDIAIDHDPVALAVHAANHPSARHLRTNVWDVDPREACDDSPVGLLWASPDCRHHSRAKGSAPRSARVRSLAWVVTRWAAAVRPRVICCENVEEWATWGPLLADGRPDPRKAGRTWRAWLARLRRCGYAIQWRSLVAADYGAPTTRRRLFLVARADGEPIAWPEPTHGKGRPLPWRTAAEVIDWSLPTRSIFGRAKPLKPATLRRIAAGVRRFVLGGARPYLASPTVAAFVSKHYTGVVGQSLELPLGTVTAVDHHALTTATLAPVGARPADAARVAAFLVSYYGSATGGQSLELPLPTATTRDRFALVTAHGAAHEVVDVRMRMLAASELARAMDFPVGYAFDAAGSQRARVRLIGNSVCPPVAEAIVRANLGGAGAWKAVA